MLAVGGIALLGYNPHVAALPKNFRNVDVFYLGAMPSVADIDEFSTLGIQTIISLHVMPEKVQQRADSLGMVTFTFPLRTRLLYIQDIMAVLRAAPPSTVYVHCLHGADRAGAVAAYWLYAERGMDPFSALAAVISPSDYHVKGLHMLGQEYAISLDSIPADILGRYSGARNGGLEGLKIRGGEWYTRLARNYLELTLGPPLNAPSSRFWEGSSTN